MILPGIFDDPVSADLSLKEYGLDVFESGVIPDPRQMPENILNCVKFPLLHFSLGHSKEPKVRWTQIRRIRWMMRAWEAFVWNVSWIFPSSWLFEWSMCM
jgi:hypothetical protein